MSKHPKGWMRLDNAALIYPAVMNRSWTALFRVSAQLDRPVDPAVLEQAFHSTLRRFPTMQVRLKRGMFWFYLERTDDFPKIEKDVGNPCVRMRLKDTGGFALRVRYYDRRIAVEFFHVLTDGTGGITFLKTLVAEYLRISDGMEIPRDGQVLDCSVKAPPEEREDSFDNHYGSNTLTRKEEKSYPIRGTDEEGGFVNIVTGIIDVGELLDRAKEKKVSLTEYLTAVMIMSVDAIQRRRIERIGRYRWVKVCVPINLRRFFGSRTMRNFSSYVNPGIDPRLGEYSFDEVLSIVHHFMAMEATKKILTARIATNVLTERNPVLRVMPLFIKNLAMKLAYSQVGDKLSSTCLSNLGAVELPEPMASAVPRMDFILGPLAENRICAGLLSYKGLLYINFTRTIVEPVLEREFFTRLVNQGVHVLIESNQR